MRFSASFSCNTLPEIRAVPLLALFPLLVAIKGTGARSEDILGPFSSPPVSTIHIEGSNFVYTIRSKTEDFTTGAFPYVPHIWL